jgi:phage major head subunit gpT-like protein
MMISAQYEDFLLANLRDIFTKHTSKMQDFIPTLYSVEKSTKAQEFNHGLGNMGLMQDWDDSGGQVYYDTVRKGYKATYTMRKLSNGLAIERELLDDAQYPEIKNRAQALSDSVYYTRQYEAVEPFNNSTTFIGPDGKALCATDHPIGPNSSTTWSNYATSTALTATNVETVRNAMKNWTDDRGNKLLINPNMLIVPKEYRKAAKIIADTDNEPYTTDYGVNVWKGALDVMEWDFLDSGMWFMVDKTRMKRYLKWYERRKPTIEKDKENFDTEVLRYKVVGRWERGFDDASFIYGCAV